METRHFHSPLIKLLLNLLVERRLLVTRREFQASACNTAWISWFRRNRKGICVIGYLLEAYEPLHTLYRRPSRCGRRGWWYGRAWIKPKPQRAYYKAREQSRGPEILFWPEWNEPRVFGTYFFKRLLPAAEKWATKLCNVCPIILYIGRSRSLVNEGVAEKVDFGSSSKFARFRICTLRIRTNGRGEISRYGTPQTRCSNDRVSCEEAINEDHTLRREPGGRYGPASCRACTELLK